MKLIYAQLQIDGWIMQNYGKFPAHEFNRLLSQNISYLSHLVYIGRGLKAHNIRETIRKELWMRASMRMYEMSITKDA